MLLLRKIINSLIQRLVQPFRVPISQYLPHQTQVPTITFKNQKKNKFQQNQTSSPILTENKQQVYQQSEPNNIPRDLNPQSQNQPISHTTPINQTSSVHHSDSNILSQKQKQAETNFSDSPQLQPTDQIQHNKLKIKSCMCVQEQSTSEYKREGSRGVILQNTANQTPDTLHKIINAQDKIEYTQKTPAVPDPQTYYRNQDLQQSCSQDFQHFSEIDYPPQSNHQQQSQHPNSQQLIEQLTPLMDSCQQPNFSTEQFYHLNPEDSITSAQNIMQSFLTIQTILDQSQSTQNQNIDQTPDSYDFGAILYPHSQKQSQSSNSINQLFQNPKNQQNQLNLQIAKHQKSFLNAFNNHQQKQQKSLDLQDTEQMDQLILQILNSNKLQTPKCCAIFSSRWHPNWPKHTKYKQQKHLQVPKQYSTFCQSAIFLKIKITSSTYLVIIGNQYKDKQQERYRELVWCYNQDQLQPSKDITFTFTRQIQQQQPLWWSDQQPDQIIDSKFDFHLLRSDFLTSHNRIIGRQHGLIRQKYPKSFIKRLGNNFCPEKDELTYQNYEFLQIYSKD